MNEQLPQTKPEHLTAKNLLRTIFASNDPENIVRQLPAESLYLTIKYHGIESTTELIEICAPEQYRLFLDFELWQKDELNEDHFWEWLSAVDENESHDPLAHFVRSIDLQVLGYIFSRYVHSFVNEEPTEAPPGPHYYSPDKGYTWVAILIEGEERYYLLGKLLAFIFETNAELFYQLLALPVSSTPSEIAEDAYQSKTRRLLSHGIPTLEESWEVHHRLSHHEAKKLLEKNREYGEHDFSLVVTPIIYDGQTLQPLGSLLEDIQTSGDNNLRDTFEMEISYLINSAIVAFSIPFHDFEAITKLADFVRKTINSGLATLHEKEKDLSLLEIYKRLGAKAIYQVGFSKPPDIF